MKPNYISVLIVAFYLSKFRDSYRNLGYKTMNSAHVDIGQKLGIKPNTLKNRRDDFDPLHDNDRVGWYQRPLMPSSKKVVECFQYLSETELREIVLQILHNPAFSDTVFMKELTHSMQSDYKYSQKKRPFLKRGVTGRRAEEHFIDHHSRTGKPQPGELIDCRDLGTGYDFEIRGIEGTYFVEIKGLDTDGGGILLTNKEWEMAKRLSGKYYLGVVHNVGNTPQIDFILDPASRVEPISSITRIVQVNWIITERELHNII